jgi:hypothetical protein
MRPLLCCLLAIISLVSAQSTLIRQQEARSLADYVHYDLPPFAVEFTTLDTAEIEVADGIISETDSQESSLSYPMRSITQEYLMEQFEQQIAADTFSEELYNHLAEVELKVILKHSSKKTIEGHVALIAEMYGKLAFVDDGTISKPSDAHVSGVFGQWLDTIFATERDLYLRRLVQSEQELLKEIVALNIITNYGSSSLQGTSKMTRTLAIVTIIVGMIGLGYICIFFAQRYRFKKRALVDHQDLQLTRDDKERSAGSLDAIQHGADSPHRRSQDILDKSDEYLSKHRPDLNEDDANNTRTFGVFGRNPFVNIFSAFQLPSEYSDADGQSSPPRGSFMPRRRAGIELQAGNIAATSERAPFDDIELSSQDSEQQQGMRMMSPAYRPFSSIWRNVSNMLEDSRYRQQNDGLVKYQDDDDYAAQIREQQLREEQWMTFQKEEETDYDFAFKDFPRKDGTPCLIYNGDNEPNHQDIFTIGSPNRSADSGDDLGLPPSENEILSDQAFRQLLHVNQASSFDREESLDLSDSNSPEFKNRLSCLFSEKHRQYEKRSIVERHRRKRKTEREQERRERQKDMHRELEALEASIPVSEKWRAKHHVSPRPYDKSPSSRASYSPNLQVRRSPRRSPVSMISNPRRSPIPMTNMPPRHHVPSKSWDWEDDSSVNLIRPRAAGPPSELFVDTRYRDSSGLDPQSLDKLSMPQMSKSASKHPSPQSVMDDIFHQSSSSMPPRNPTAHRRATSSDLHDYKRGELETIGAMSPARRGLSPARRGMSPARQTMSPATRGRRPVRGISPSPKQRSSSNSSRNSRAGSTDGVFDHGIAALV